MKVCLAELIDDQKKELDLALDVDIKSLKYLGDEIVFIKPVIFKGKINKSNAELYIEGIVEGVADCDCYRCLKKFELKIEGRVHEKLIEEDSNQSEIDECFEIHDKSIDISEIIENTLILSLPMQIICDEDCKGLCSVCGKDLNIHSCDCKKDEIDPRLAKLKDLLQQD